MILLLIIIFYYILTTTSIIFILSKKNKLKKENLLISNDLLKQNNYKIPYIIHLTYDKMHKIPNKVWDQYKKYAPEYKIEFYDNSRCEKIIKTYFNSDVLKKFKSLKRGAHKADLFRYCILYIYGGIYFDIKSQVETPIRIFINHNKSKILYSCIGIETNRKILYSCIGIETNRKILKYNTIYQGFIASYPKNPIFLDLILHICNSLSIRLKFDYHFFIKEFYSQLEKRVGKKLIVGINSYKNSDEKIQLFIQKNIRKNNERRDKHNSYSGICLHKDSDNRLIRIRFSDFPWK